MSKVEKLARLAQAVADETPGFFEVGGAGSGNLKTNEFMRNLRLRVEDKLGPGYDERRICGSGKLAVDFHIPEESTIIEVALSLRNPNTEFERDILKALMAKGKGVPVENLLFLSKLGAADRHEQASSRAMIDWVLGHGIHVEIRDLVDHRNA